MERAEFLSKTIFWTQTFRSIYLHSSEQKLQQIFWNFESLPKLWGEWTSESDDWAQSSSKHSNSYLLRVVSITMFFRTFNRTRNYKFCLFFLITEWNCQRCRTRVVHHRKIILRRIFRLRFETTQKNGGVRVCVSKYVTESSETILAFRWTAKVEFKKHDNRNEWFINVKSFLIELLNNCVVKILDKNKQGTQFDESKTNDE